MERFNFLHKGKIRSGDFVAGIVNLLKKGRTVEALELCNDTPGPVAAIVRGALLNMRKPREEFELALQAVAASEIPLLEKRVHTLLFLSRFGQLLGALAALLAFREPFAAALKLDVPVISTQAFSASVLLAVGYLALAVGISAVLYLCYHLLNGRVRALVAEMERAAVEIESQLAANAIDENASAH